MNFALSQNNVLFVSAGNKLFAASLNDLQSYEQYSEDNLSIQVKTSNRAEQNLDRFGPDTKYGSITFDPNFKILLLYDKEKPSNDECKSIYGIWERHIPQDHQSQARTLIDYNIIHADPTKDDLDLYIYQSEQLIDRDGKLGNDRVKEYQHL